MDVRPLPPPAGSLPRRVPQRRLPERRYVPGLGPHPSKTGAPGLYNADGTDFDYACDLFDHRFYWESHEVWEGLWRDTQDGPERQRLQGLIQAAAFVLKTHVGHDGPAATLLERVRLRLGSDDPLLSKLEAFRDHGIWPSIGG